MTPTIGRKNMTDRIDDEDVREVRTPAGRALAKGRLA